MNVRNRAIGRPLFLLVILLLLSGSMFQPATPLLAQQEPPLTPTASPTPSATPTSEQTTEADPNNHIWFEGDPMPTAPATNAVTSTTALTSTPTLITTPAPQLAGSPALTAVTPQATNDPKALNIVAKSTVLADTDLTYTIYFTNTSGTAYQNVLIQDVIGIGHYYTGCDSTSTCPYTVTDSLKSSVSIYSLTGSGSSYDSREIVWKITSLAAGQSGKIMYTTHIYMGYRPETGKNATVLGNTIAWYKDGTISDATKLNEDSWGTTIIGPALYLVKTVDKSVVLEGDKLTYTITVGNATGPGDQPDGVIRTDAIDATNVKVYDAVPAQLENIVVQNGGTYSSSTGKINWTVGNLNKGSSTTLSFSGTVKTTLTQCSSANNSDFAVTSDEIPYDSANETHYWMSPKNSASTTIWYPATLDLKVATADPIYVNDTVVWNVTVKNYWRSAMSGLQVKFYLPSTFSYVSSSDSGQVNAQQTAVTWTINMDAGSEDLQTPAQKVLTVTTKAGKVIHGNTGSVAFITPLPNSVPSGCITGSATADANVNSLLYATKTVNVTTSVLSGTDVIYTVVLQNISSSDMTDVSMTDTIPAPRSATPFIFKYMLDDGPAPYSTSSTLVTWKNLTVPGGTKTSPGKTTLRFVMTARGIPSDCKDNKVSLTTSATGVDDASGGTVCIAFPWYVTKSVDRTSVDPRTTDRKIQYTLTYISLIDDDQDIYPEDYPTSPYPYDYSTISMVSGPTPASTPSGDDHLITWPKITLQGKQSVIYKFTIDLPTNGDSVIPSGSYCNTGYMEPIGMGYYIYGNTVCTYVSSIVMNANIYASRGSVSIGELVTYEIQLTNQSSSAVGGLVISDTLPANFTYVGPAKDTTEAEVTTLEDGRSRLTWSDISVPQNSTVAIDFSVRAPALIGSYTNYAEVTGGNPVPAFSCSGVSAAGGCLTNATLQVYSLLAIDATASSSTVEPGDIVTYTLKLFNNNDIDYEETVITFSMPLGFTYINSISGGAPGVVSGNKLMWYGQTLTRLQNSATGTLTYEFSARAPLSYGSFRSKAEASSTTGLIPTADNVARILISPPAPAMSKIGPSLADLGSQVTFKISVVNPTATDLTDVVVTDPLPDGFTYLGMAEDALDPDVSGQTLTWHISSVPASTDDGPGIVELEFYTQAPEIDGTYTNTATVSGGGSGVTIDQTYNSVSVRVADLIYLFLPFTAVS